VSQAVAPGGGRVVALPAWVETDEHRAQDLSAWRRAFTVGGEILNAAFICRRSGRKTGGNEAIPPRPPGVCLVWTHLRGARHRPSPQPSPLKQAREGYDSVIAKVFWFFFSKKNCFFLLPYATQDASLFHPTILRVSRRGFPPVRAPRRGRPAWRCHPGLRFHWRRFCAGCGA